MFEVLKPYGGLFIVSVLVAVFLINRYITMGFCFHLWGKWSGLREAFTTRAFGRFGETAEVKIVIQTRACKRCLKVVKRHVHDGEVSEEIT